MMLSMREKLLVGLLVVLLAAGGVWFGAKAVAGYERSLVARTVRQEALLNRVQALQTELTRLRRQPAGVELDRPLIGYVERLAEQIQLKDRIQLNAVPQQTLDGVQGVDLRVDNLTLDEAVNLLYILEDAEAALVIDQLEISPAFRDKSLLRLSMRVLAGTG